MDNQNELVQSLRKQLEATERELANQKWVFERFLESPSWRLTSPIRWAAKHMRALRDRLRGAGGFEPPAPAKAGAYDQIEEPDQSVSPQLKEFITATHRASLKNFLSVEASLQLPCSEKPDISVILVLHNRAELTLHCLRSISDQDFRNLEVIIVDNASTDETVEMLGRTAGARIIRNSENHNFLLAVNQAAREARGEYILLLNNDTELMSGTLGAAFNTIRSAPDIGAVGGRLILLDWSLQEAGSIVWHDGSCLGYGRGDNPFAPMYMFRRDVDYCSAAFLLTARATWGRLGGFDEAFKPAYYEDSDYCARLWEHGLRVVYEPDAVVLHYEFGSSANVSKAISLQREHQNLFASRHQAWLSKHPAAGADAILPARMTHSGKRVLLIEDRVPHPWLGSGFPRARAILLSLIRQGYFVTFYPVDEFEEAWNCVYSDMPREIEFMLGYGPPLLEPFLRHRHDYYDMIFVSRPHNMKLLQPLLSAHPEWFRNATLIYDAEALFAAREIEFRKVHGSPLPPQETEQIVKEEVALAGLADTVIAVSEPERNEFQKCGISTVHVLGHSVAVRPGPRGFHEREGFLFVGAIHDDTTPNGDSVIWFLEEIFPRIQAELGDSIPFTIAGINASERVRQLGRLATPAVRITGHLPDISDLYDSARVFVAPTRFSAGIPQKIHDAAARGVPVVGTPLLASQLGWHEGSPLLVAGDADTFTQMIRTSICRVARNAE